MRKNRPERRAKKGGKLSALARVNHGENFSPKGREREREKRSYSGSLLDRLPVTAILCVLWPLIYIGGECS